MKRKLKDFIVDPKGQWNHPGKKTYIPNANGSITMRGVPYPVLGIDDQGNQQMMYPNGEYQFPGNGVYEIPMAQKGLQTGKTYNQLFQEYKKLQEEVNQRQQEENQYEERLNAGLVPLINKDVKKTGYIPKHILEGIDPVTGHANAFCIAGVCYSLNQATGEPIKYFSNIDLQNDLKDKKVKGRFLDQSEKGLKPGDILQFKYSDKGKPYHAFLVTKLHEPDETGNRKIEVFGSHGSGIQNYHSYYLNSNNKVFKIENGNEKYMPTQVVKRDVDPRLHQSLIERDNIKKELEDAYPNAFRNLKVNTDTFNPTAFVKSDNLYNYISESGDEDESINLSASKLDEILTQFSNPDFKKNFMEQQQVSNDEYDAIVKNVVGIYGAESKFGTGYGTEPLWLQKHFGALTDSIGPFQINPKQLQTKRFDRKDFFDPVIGSEIAATFLAENLPLLRNRAKAQPGDKHYSENLNQDNYLEYLPYLMNQQGLLKGDEYTKEEKPGRLAKFFGLGPTPTPENKLVGDSDYNLRVKDYVKKLGFEAIRASTRNVFETPEETEYQDGGTFNPDTDEFIGFADELPKAQEGLEKKGFDSLSESQKTLLQKGNNLDKVKGWYEQNPEAMQNFQRFMNEHNVDNYINLYNTEQKNFDTANKNNAEWHKQWYAKRAQLPQFKNVATQRLNSYSNLDSAKLIDPVNYAFKYWAANNASAFKDKNSPPETFYFPTDKLYGHQSDTEKEINVNSKLFNEGNYNVNNKLYNQTLTHETNHQTEDMFPQEGTVNHLNKNSWKNRDTIKDPIQNILTYEDILKDARTNSGSDVYQYQPTEVRSRLDIWRQYNNIDPLKNYSDEDIRSIMQKNMEDPNVPRNIKELYKTIQETPSKLKYLHNSYVSNDKQSPLDKFLPQNDIQKAQVGQQTGERFVEMDIPSHRYQPDLSEGQTYIKDPRVWNPVTNSRIVPTRDLKAGNYSNNVIRRLTEAAYRNNRDPYFGIAAALQETNLGKTDPNFGHVLNVKPYPNPTPEDDIYRAQNEAYQKAKRLGYTTPEMQLQVYNGLGKIFPTTEQNYHGFKAKSFYGVPVPKEGIDLKKNPLYGKQIVNLRDSVLLQNPDLVNFVNKATNDYADKYSIEQAANSFRNVDLTDMDQLRSAMTKFAKTNPREFKRIQEKYLKNNKKQTGGTFNPDTDEFIGYSDELESYQKGRQVKPTYLSPDQLSARQVMEPSTTRVAPVVNHVKEAQYRAQAAKDVKNPKITDDDFRDKHGYNKHVYQMNNDPKYKAEVEANAKELVKRNGSIDLPSTYMDSKSYVGNPNAAFMNPNNLTGEAAKANEEFHGNIINAFLPIPGLQQVGKVPSVLGASKNAIIAAGKTLDKFGNVITTQTPLRNAYKLNPWSFQNTINEMKPSSEFAYRTLGRQEGFENVLNSGFITPKPGGAYDMQHGAAFYNANYPLLRYSDDLTYLDGKFIAKDGPKYIAEVPLSNPKVVSRYADRPDKYRITKGTNEGGLGHVGINEPGVTIYKEDWLRGYKPVNNIPINSSVENAGNLTLRGAESLDEVAKIPVPKAWEMEELPGLHLRSTMSDNPQGLHKYLAKDGTIETKSALEHIKRMEGDSKYDVVLKNMQERFGTNLENMPKRMDYNTFRKNIQEDLWDVGTGKGVPVDQYAGLDMKEFGIIKNDEPWLTGPNLESHIQSSLGYDRSEVVIDGYSFTNKDKFIGGSNAHSMPEETLGHTRGFTNPNEPDIYYSAERQSNWAQEAGSTIKKTDIELLKKQKETLPKLIKEQEDLIAAGNDSWAIGQKERLEGQLKNVEETINSYNRYTSASPQEKLVMKNMNERMLQEDVAHIASKGYSKYRMPTEETMAKIQGFKKGTDFDMSLLTPRERIERLHLLEEYKRMPENVSDELWDEVYNPMYKKIEALNKKGLAEIDYPASQKSILKHTSQSLKDAEKLFGVKLNPVTDSKGNTWYEFDIPEKFRKGKAEIKALALGGAILGTRKLKSKKQGGTFNPNTDEFLGFVD
jgi:hypothetical protein